jgi:cyclophilin family peptidyl-prolyl cis-trans isomerase
MPQSAKKTRERHLAKLAARRAAERRRKRRQRLIATGVGLFLVLGLVSGLGVVLLNGGKPKTAAKPSATPSTSPTPTVSPGSSVACGARVPEGAFVNKPNFKKEPALTVDETKKYTVTMKTSCGTIRLELFPKEAPVTVNSFVFLAKKHFFDGLTFHRIVANFVIQGGDPKGTGEGGPGYTFKDELKNDLKYEVGTLAMANSGADTNGSQFFIVAGSDGTTLPKQYTIFGKVTKGMDVVEKINALPTVGASDPQNQDKPLATVYIDKVTIKVS